MQCNINYALFKFSSYKSRKNTWKWDAHNWVLNEWALPGLKVRAGFHQNHLFIKKLKP